jgi:hypothetical protein
MPSGEMGNIPQLGSIQSTSSYVDVMSINAFQFMDDTYNGSHGYRDRTYLVPNDREMFYVTRRRISYYVNVLKPIINAAVYPVFSKGVTRETSNAMFSGFVDNCDNAGTSLDVFMRNALLNAKLYSVNFIVMDNFKGDELSALETEDSVVASRRYPYIYEKAPQEVYAHTTTEHGKLETITFLDKYEEITIDGKKECRQYYRSWDSNTWRLFYIVRAEGKEREVEVEQGTHGLGVLPVIAIVDFANSASLKTLPNPDLYDMAFLCFGLFNKESEVRWMEVMQTFAILCTSGLGKQSLAIGPATALDSGVDSKFAPQYVAPPQDGIKVLIDNCQRLKEEIRAQAQQKGIVGVKDAKSGIAKEWDFRAEEAILRETSKAGTRVEHLLAELFGLYVKASIEYTVTYPMEFSPLADSNRIDTAIALLKETPPAEVEKALWAEITGIYWKGDDEKIEEITESLDDNLDEKNEIDKMKNEESVVE